MIAASWFPLSDHRLVALSGRDAIAFAQAQTMNDVATLHDGEWQWNGWLTAKGRVIALFAAVRVDCNTLWLVLPDADADQFVAQLRRFVFRSKVDITLRDDLLISGRRVVSELASGNHWVGDPASAIELDLSGDLDEEHSGRSLRIGPAAASPADPEQLERWRLEDLAHGWPRLAAAQAEKWTPQQLSLDRLRAYSVKKGCYPGQEIVARTHFLGEAKRGLVLIHTETLLAPGMELQSQGATVGTVVSVSGQVALAVLPLALQHEKTPADGGVSWEQQPLRTGLAR